MITNSFSLIKNLTDWVASQCWVTIAVVTIGCDLGAKEQATSRIEIGRLLAVGLRLEHKIMIPSFPGV